MEHPLDNPVWHALRTGNQALAIGDDLARVLPPDVGAFAGVADYSAHFLNSFNKNPFYCNSTFFLIQHRKSHGS